MRQAGAGRGRVVLVGGEAGVGKSTLADEFCRRVADAAAVLLSQALMRGAKCFSFDACGTGLYPRRFTT